MMFKVMSVKYISTMANSTLMGMEKAIMHRGLTSRRNRASTRIARIPPRIRVLQHRLDDHINVVP